MRINIIGLSIILYLTGCDEKPAESTMVMSASDVAMENLKGNVTEIELDTYNIDSVKGKPDVPDEKSVEKFDSAGYTISYKTMNGKDSLKTEMTIERMPDMRMKSMTTTGGKGEKKSAMTFEVDSAGNYLLARSFDSTGKMDVYYNDITTLKSGLVAGGKGYHPDSTLKTTFINNFDSLYYTGGVTKDSVGNITYESKIDLNAKKDPAKMDETVVTKDDKTKKDSTKHTVTTYTYGGWDKNGNWTEQTTMNEKGKTVKVVKRIITYKE